MGLVVLPYKGLSMNTPLNTQFGSYIALTSSSFHKLSDADLIKKLTQQLKLPENSLKIGINAYKDTFIFLKPTDDNKLLSIFTPYKDEDPIIHALRDLNLLRSSYPHVYQITPLLGISLKKFQDLINYLTIFGEKLKLAIKPLLNQKELFTIYCKNQDEPYEFSNKSGQTVTLQALKTSFSETLVQDFFPKA